MVSCWQSCTFSHYWLNRFQLTEHDLAPISVRCNQLQWCTNWSKIGTMCCVFFFRPCFSMNHETGMCAEKGCHPAAAWNSSLLMLCSVNQVSWAVTTSLRIRAESPISSSVHSPPPVCNLITQMKQAQTISSYKIRNCIWQFLNKCIQVQLKAFQFCQVLVE